MKPKPVAAITTTSMLDYLRLAYQHGAVHGPAGAQQIAPEVAPLLEAIHHVLSGAKVKVDIVEPGERAVFEKLEKGLAQARKDRLALSALFDDPTFPDFE